MQEVLAENLAYSFRNNLFYQRDFHGFAPFEHLYIAIRKKESRLYADGDVTTLPRVSCSHPLSKEWKRRAFSMHRLMNYLKRGKGKKILEVGCGNGWLCHHLSGLPEVEVAGIDVNETELLQAARVFKNIKNLTFIYGNILQGLPIKEFDHIILSASLQYFPDACHLLRGLFRHLADDGQIHITDTPMYSPSSVMVAARRSAEYFSSYGVPEMEHHYHHHTLEAIATFNPRMNYDPKTLLNRVRQKLVSASPFPWIIIDSAC